MIFQRTLPRRHSNLPASCKCGQKARILKGKDTNDTWTKRASIASVWGAAISALGIIIGVVGFSLAYTAFKHDERVRRSTLIANAWTLLNSNLSESANRGQADSASILLNNNISLKGLETADANLERMNVATATPRADFSWADLCHSNLRGSSLGNISLEGTIFGPLADLTDITSLNADLSMTYLNESRLSNSNFSGARFWRADLRGAFADGVDFSGAELFYADMRNIMFSSFTFLTETGAKKWKKPTNLTGAEFYGADLRGADLEKVVGLTTKALEGACLDASTKLPVGVKMPNHLCEIEVPKGKIMVRNAIGFYGRKTADTYLERVKACGFKGTDLPPAIRMEHPGFTIKTYGQ
ncbi:pentapeptide repeat-containing protein [Thalassospira xiamenensis]|uniref:pentapeptide repeat-containing protein n=1 Tax=Thalassospira xiamenensis TaxID=220697 RepID=UPI001FFFF11E|nr:pentapeptide repeat-containing protein [Thalassospira xiamenensis]MCK2167183.1 pentapeptide repeat-containing protein [Thalassospira xiamenensis]